MIGTPTAEITMRALTLNLSILLALRTFSTFTNNYTKTDRISVMVACACGIEGTGNEENK